MEHDYSLAPRYQPLLLPALAGLTGAALAPSLATPATALAAASAAVVGLGAVAVLRRQLWLLALLVALGAGLASAALAARSEERAASRPLRQLVDRGRFPAATEITFTGTAACSAVPTPAGIAVDIRVDTVAAMAAPGSLRVWVAEPAEIEGLIVYGQAIEGRGTVADDLACRNPGNPTLRDSLRRAGIDLAVRARAGSLRVIGDSHACPLRKAIDSTRCRLLTRTSHLLSPRAGGLLRASLLGDGSQLDPADALAFRRTGLFHLLVVSGAHVALLGMLVLGPWRGKRPASAVRLVMALVVVWGYAIALGLPPPVLRASLAFSLGLLGLATGRTATGANTVAATMLVALVLDPGSPRDPSFQLTFAAAAAIALIAAPLLSKLEAVGRWRPTPLRPFPPRCNKIMRWLAEALYWSPRRFEAWRSRSPGFRYRLDKPRVAGWLERVRVQQPLRWLFASMVVTATVQAVLLPLAAVHFHRLSPLAILTTPIVELLLAAFMVCGGCLLAVNSLLMIDLSVPAQALDAVGTAVCDAARFTSDFRWAAVAIPAPPARGLLAGAFITLATAVGAAAVARWRLAGQSHAGNWACPAAAVALVCVAYLTLLPPVIRGDGRLHALFLDVGQGDAALFVLPNGETMLVDAGGAWRGASAADDRARQSVLSLGLTRLDRVVATHGDRDHIGGFFALFDEVEVGSLVVPALRDPALDQLVEYARGCHVPVVELSSGWAITTGGARVAALWPDPQRAPASDNDRSLVIRIEACGRAILLTGDISRAAEIDLVASGHELRADVLKVAHHGSRHSSTDAFLGAVAATWAIVPAPLVSRYGHPHGETLARLESNGCRVVHLGRRGATAVVLDERMVKLHFAGEQGEQLVEAVLPYHGAQRR